MNMEVKEPRGRLGILIPGMGAVATTLIAGVEAVKKGIAQPIGSLTQMGHIHLNRKTGENYPRDQPIRSAGFAAGYRFWRLGYL